MNRGDAKSSLKGWMARYMGNAKEALKKLGKLEEELLGDDNVLLAYVFGSCVHGFVTLLSDVDVAVILKDNSLERLGELWSKLARALGLSEDRIDLVDLSRADDVLVCQVVDGGIKIVDKGFYEEKLHEKLYVKLFDTMAFLDSYVKESSDPLRREVLVRKLMALDEEVRILETYVLSREIAQVAEDPVMKRVLRDSVRVAIESTIDLCKHVVASKRLGVVREYKDFPLKLAEAGLMPRDLAQRLSEFAKLRNIIVHRYVELDYIHLYEKAKEFVNSVAPALRRQIEELLQSVKQ